MGKRDRFRDHVDPEYRRWGHEYRGFPGVDECVRLILDGKTRGAWGDIVVFELAENAPLCLPELIGAYRESDSSTVRLYVLMALEMAALPSSTPFLAEVLHDGDSALVPYAERALIEIDTPDSRRELWNVNEQRDEDSRPFA
jgi:hypothetical protein